MAQPTVLVTAKIDVSPNGVSITFEGLDKDIAELMAKAQVYVADPTVYRTYDTSDLVVRTRKVIQFVEPTTIEVDTTDTGGTTGSTTP